MEEQVDVQCTQLDNATTAMVQGDQHNHCGIHSNSRIAMLAARAFKVPCKQTYLEC